MGGSPAEGVLDPLEIHRKCITLDELSASLDKLPIEVQDMVIDAIKSTGKGLKNQTLFFII